MPWSSCAFLGALNASFGPFCPAVAILVRSVTHGPTTFVGASYAAWPSLSVALSVGIRVGVVCHAHRRPSSPSPSAQGRAGSCCSRLMGGWWFTPSPGSPWDRCAVRLCWRPLGMPGPCSIPFDLGLWCGAVNGPQVVGSHWEMQSVYDGCRDLLAAPEGLRYVRPFQVPLRLAPGLQGSGLTSAFVVLLFVSVLLVVSVLVVRLVFPGS